MIQPSDTGSQAGLSSKHGQPVAEHMFLPRPKQRSPTSTLIVVQRNWRGASAVYNLCINLCLVTNFVLIFFFPGCYRKPSRYNGYKDDHVEKS